jgi:MarR family transcriptional regulator for hemolysin
MKIVKELDIPVGTRALILSKRYYGVLTKSLEDLDIERYYSILYFLYNHSGCPQQHICNSLVIDKTAMVKVMDYLTKAGYVKRQVNPNDRREHVIDLTAKGKRKTEEIVKSFKAIDKEIFSGISKNDRSAFMKVMSKLTSNLDNLPANVLLFDYRQTRKTKRNNSIQ